MLQGRQLDGPAKRHEALARHGGRGSATAIPSQGISEPIEGSDTRLPAAQSVAFTSNCAYWISYCVFVRFLAPGIKAGADLNAAAGVFLLGWTIFTFYMMIASVRVSGAVLSVFVALTVTFVLLAIGAFDANSALIYAGGWVGLFTAALVWYASAAGVIIETFKRVIVPVFPLAPKSGA
jgi:succinate-acetate transporter protein